MMQKRKAPRKAEPVFSLFERLLVIDSTPLPQGGTSQCFRVLRAHFRRHKKAQMQLHDYQPAAAPDARNNLMTSV
jgi:hypothetical protein